MKGSAMARFLAIKDIGRWQKCKDPTGLYSFRHQLFPCLRLGIGVEVSVCVRM